MIWTKPLGESEFHGNKALFSRALEYRQREIGSSFSDSVPKKSIRIAKLAKKTGYILKPVLPKVRPAVKEPRLFHGGSDLGLSNVSKTGNSKFRTQISVSPGNIKLKIQDRIAWENDGLPHLRSKNSNIRQPVREFSSSSRMNMIRRTNDIEGLGIRPHIMITLTYPGRWLEAVLDGKAAKKHLTLFRDRLRKHLMAKYGLKMSMFWFLEFQKRGAPHFHLLIWTNQEKSYLDVRLREYVSLSWQQIVNAPDENERRLHRYAGTKVEKMRKGHFGYAKMYASKPRQKQVPDGWLNVGRFWGFFGVPKFEPLSVTWYTEDIYNIFVNDCCRIAGSIGSVAPEFARLFLMRVAKMIQHGNGYGSWTFHGQSVVAAYLLPQLE